MPTLAEELATDPLNLGYAPLLEVADDLAVAALLNARTGDGADTLTLTHLPRNEWLAGTVSDRVMAQGELDALTTRIGSRAEVLWGAGTIITPDQVGAAR